MDDWTTKPHLTPGTRLSSVWMNQGATGYRVGASARTITVVLVDGKHWVRITPVDHHGRETNAVYFNMALIEEVTLEEQA
ncbi:hypothetical protein DRO27_03805 [Candidatus Bathyarchaeota archaeon]|nr:MAG: hypothetical protein DRO27_03805 [Candidatus Bathyarchaeota archaeon]